MSEPAPEPHLSVQQMGHPDSFVNACRGVRVGIKTLAAEVRQLHRHPALATQSQLPGFNLEEIDANITLAYRHLEDAAMRLGKTIQAYDGGISVYDK